MDVPIPTPVGDLTIVPVRDPSAAPSAGPGACPCTDPSGDLTVAPAEDPSAVPYERVCRYTNKHVRM